MRISLFVVMLLCLGACSEQSPPPEQPYPSITLTMPSYQPPPSLPPTVSRPLDASAYRARICDIFTNEQAIALGIPGTPRLGGSPEFIFCGRETKDPPFNFSLVYAGPELFGKIYRESKAPLDYTKLVTIAGQPALEYGSPVLDGSVPFCQIVLGLANDQAIQIDVNFHTTGSGACDRATKVAEAIVHNLGG